MSWKRTTLRAAAEVALGRQRSPQHAEGPHMRPYLRAANVKDGVLDLTSVHSMNFSPKEQAIFSLKPGDVLVTEGSGSIGSVGAANVWRGEIEGVVCFQNTLLRLRPRSGTDPNFLGWWARAAYGSGLFASIASGANIYHISAERVRALPMDLPPLEEQRRIADFLDAETAYIDRLIHLRGEASSLLVQRERALLDAQVESLADRFGVLPFRRFIRRIEQGTSPQCDNVPAGPGEWGVLKVSAVKGGRFLSDQNKRLPDELKPAHQYEVRDGDLLITRANTPALVGAAAVAERPRSRLMLCDKIFRVDVAADMSKKYLALVAQGTRIRDLCAEASHGTSQSMANLKTDEIKQWPIPVAPLKEQQALVERLEATAQVSDELVASIKTQVELLEERRRAVVTAAVTGELDVTTARRVS